MGFTLLNPSYGLRVDIIDAGQRRHTPMNRRKKIKQLLEAHAKKANAKLAPKSNKPKYISKADRAKLEAEAAQEPLSSVE
jgi:ribosomal protein L14E/L6E/L27E